MLSGTVRVRRAKNKALKDALKYKTAHLLMLAHGK